ncbi:MAG: YetF domain-containing protein [Ginsengibacter sp.]
MTELINTLFGHGRDLDILQMAMRAFVLFFIALGLIRLAGMRTFGIKSAFDDCVIIMLGAVLSRAITGASAFFPTIGAALVLVLVHRLLAYISVYNKTISHLVKGKPVSIYSNGKLNDKTLRRCNLSFGDIMEEARLQANQNNLDDIEEIFMERTGKISFIKKGSSSKLGPL